MSTKSYQVTGHIAVFNPETGCIEQREVQVQAKETEVITQVDIIEAQVAYTAMMTGTLLEV